MLRYSTFAQWLVLYRGTSHGDSGLAPFFPVFCCKYLPTSCLSSCLKKIQAANLILSLVFNRDAKQKDFNANSEASTSSLLLARTNRSLTSVQQPCSSTIFDLQAFSPSTRTFWKTRKHRLPQELTRLVISVQSNGQLDFVSPNVHTKTAIIFPSTTILSRGQYRSNDRST